MATSRGVSPVGKQYGASTVIFVRLGMKPKIVQGANKKESSIRLNLQFNKFDRSTLDSKLLSDTPYLYIFFTECSDGDLYKEKVQIFFRILSFG